jgi:hypothetical protein
MSVLPSRNFSESYFDNIDQPLSVRESIKGD